MKTNVEILRELLNSKPIVKICGAYDAMSAKLVENAGFDAIWAGSFAISATHALPDASIMTMTEFLNVASNMVESCKIPVIATPVGDIKNIVCHMENIYSINPHFPDEMLQGILFLMNNEQARIKIVENAYKLVLKFDWQQVAKRHLEIYKKILKTI